MNIDKGGTLRLGSYPCKIAPGYHDGALLRKRTAFHERHRHRYEFNNDYRDAVRRSGTDAFSGTFAGRTGWWKRVELRPITISIVGVQYHPEFKSRPNSAHPLFMGFVSAAMHKN